MDETPIKVKIVEKPKKPSIKIIKYRKARLKGMNKEQAKLAAGYAPSTTTVAIEAADTYKRISVGDAILEHISLKEIAAINAETIRQDKDLGARNTATKLAYERIEPDNAPPDVTEHVIVVLK